MRAHARKINVWRILNQHKAFAIREWGDLPLHPLGCGGAGICRFAFTQNMANSFKSLTRAQLWARFFPSEREGFEPSVPLIKGTRP